MNRAITISIAAFLLAACGGAPVPATTPAGEQTSAAPVQIETVAADALEPRAAEEAAALKYRGDAVFVEGTTVYRSASGGLVIGEMVDDWTAFRERGVVYTPDASTDVVVRDGYAFVASGPRGITVVDVKDAAAPRAVANIPTKGASMRMDLDGERLLVAEGVAGVKLLDVSDPTSPSLVGAWESEGYARHAVLNGDAVYVAEGRAGVSKLIIADGKLELAWRHETGGQVRAVGLREDRLFVADGPKGVAVLDVSGEPKELGRLQLDDMARDLLLSEDGSRVFVASGDDGIIVVSVEDPGALRKTGELVPDKPTNRIRRGEAGRIFVGNDADGLLILDVTAPDEPRRVYPADD